MCHAKRNSPNNLDEQDPEDKAFFESALSYMAELDNQAGDWRIHLPHEALLSYGEDSVVREQFADQFNSTENQVSQTPWNIDKLRVGTDYRPKLSACGVYFAAET